jgi:putative peptidoglycan lipid II flippase
LNLKLSIGTLAALQLAASLAVQVAVLRLVGAGRETDAYVAAQTVPMVVFAIVSASLNNLWQARFAVLHEDTHALLSAQRQAQGQVVVVFGSLFAVLAVTSAAWLQWLFPGFTAEQRAQALAMTLPLLGASWLQCHVALIVAALRARERFLAPELVGLAGTAAALLLIVLLVPRLGIEAASWITLARAFAVYGVLFLNAGRPTPYLPGVWRERDSWRQLWPLISSSALYKAGPLVDRFWSSQASAGGMTLFGLAQAGIVAAATVLERALCMPVNSRMGRAVALGDYVGVRRDYRSAIKHVSIAVAMVGLVLVLLRPLWDGAAATVLKVNTDDAQRLWWFMVLLLGHLHVAASGTVCVAVFYAMADTKTPSAILIAGFLVGVAAKSIGFVFFGLVGLAAATSIYHALNMTLLIVAVERRLLRETRRTASHGG